MQAGFEQAAQGGWVYIGKPLDVQAAFAKAVLAQAGEQVRAALK
jgi:hypothetical protein